jgi:hypothetical protein
MGRIRVANSSSDAKISGFVGVASAAPTKAGNRIYLHEISVAPRVADFDADVSLYLYDTYEGMGSELVDSGNFTPVTGDALYTSDFVPDVDGWTDIAGAAMTLTFNQTIDSVTGCLKCVADGGGDESSFVVGGEVWLAAGVTYELKFDYFAETAGNMSFWGGGLNGASTTSNYATGSGQQIAVVENAWTTCTQYITGGVENADIHLSAFTAQDGQTADALAAGKYVAFKNVTIKEVTNNADWTLGATGWTWILTDKVADKVVNGTTALAQTLTTPAVGDLYQVVYTLTEAVAGVTPAYGGVTMAADAGAATHTSVIVATNSSNRVLTFTADATAVVTIDDISVKKMGGITNTNYMLRDSIREGVTTRYVRTFESKQPVSQTGFGLLAVQAGTACILDMVMVYEVV